MRKRSLGCALLACVLVVPSAAQESVAPDSPRWNRSGTELSIENHLGRPSVHLRSGMLLLDDVVFTNGIIEFDVALPEARGFLGVVWRVESPGDYEHFYLRPHQSGNPDACQYTPVFNGVSGWQLYAGAEHATAIDYAFDRWTHVKVVVWERRAAIYVDSEAPRIVANLEREVSAGSIGLDVARFAPAHFSNFTYDLLEEPPPMPARKTAPLPSSEVVPSWSVSSAFPEARLTGEALLADDEPPGLTWTELVANSAGLANLARVQGIDRGADTCFAKVRLVSQADQLASFEFGFSDRARLYLNGRLLYAGDNGYRTRDYRFLGTIGYFDRVTLPLRAGANEIVFAVSESFGGWGVQARFAGEAEVSFE